MKEGRKKLINGLVKLLGPVILVIVLTRINLKEFSSAFERANFLYVAIGMGCSFLIPAFRSMRWNLINRTLGVRMGFWETARAQFIGNAAAMITPARMGMELFRFFFARNLGYPPGQVIKGIVLDRLYDLVLLLLIFLIGVPNLKYAHNDVLLVISGLLLVVLLAPLFYVLTSSKNRFASQIIRKVTPKSLRGERQTEQKEGMLSKDRVSVGYFLVFLCLSLFVILINAARIDFFVSSLGIHIGFVFIIWCSSAVVICNYLPISFMGIGVRDVTLVYFFSTRGIDPADSIYISTLILGSLILQAISGSAVYILSRKKIGLITGGTTASKTG